MNSKRVKSRKVLPIELQYKALSFLGMSGYDSEEVLALEEKNKKEKVAKEKKEVKETKASTDDLNFSHFLNTFVGEALLNTRNERLTFLKGIYKETNSPWPFQMDKLTRINQDDYERVLYMMPFHEWFIELIDTTNKPNMTLADLAGLAALDDMQVMEDRFSMIALPSRNHTRQLDFINQLAKRNQLDLIIKIYKENPHYPLITPSNEVQIDWKMLTEKIIAEKKWELVIIWSRRADYAAQKYNDNICLPALLKAMLETDDEQLLVTVLSFFEGNRTLEAWYYEAFRILTTPEPQVGEAKANDPKAIEAKAKEAEAKAKKITLNLNRVMFGLVNGIPCTLSNSTSYWDYAYETNNLELFGKILIYYIRHKQESEHQLSTFFDIMQKFSERDEPKARPFQKMLLATKELYTPALFNIFKPLLARRVGLASQYKQTPKDICSWMVSAIYPLPEDAAFWPASGPPAMISSSVLKGIIAMDQKGLFGRGPALNPDDLLNLAMRLVGDAKYPNYFWAVVNHREAILKRTSEMKSDWQPPFTHHFDALLKKYQVAHPDNLIDKLRDFALAGDFQAVKLIYCYAAADHFRRIRFAEQVNRQDESGQTLIHHLVKAKPTPENAQVFRFFEIILCDSSYRFIVDYDGSPQAMFNPTMIDKNHFLKPDKAGVTPLHIVLQFGNLAQAKNLLIHSDVGRFEGNLRRETLAHRNMLDCIVANQNREIYDYIANLLPSDEKRERSYDEDQLSHVLKNELLGLEFERFENHKAPIHQSEIPKLFDFYFNSRKKDSAKAQLDALCVAFSLNRPIDSFLDRLDLLKVYSFAHQIQFDPACELKQEAFSSVPMQVLRKTAERDSFYRLTDNQLKKYINAKLLIASENADDQRSGIFSLVSIFERHPKLVHHFANEYGDFQYTKAVAVMPANLTKTILAFRQKGLGNTPNLLYRGNVFSNNHFSNRLEVKETKEVKTHSFAHDQVNRLSENYFNHWNTVRDAKETKEKKSDPSVQEAKPRPRYVMSTISKR